jgi:hypothetical protein
MTVCLLIFFAWPKRERAEHIIVGGGLMRDEDVAALKKCTSKK